MKYEDLKVDVLLNIKQLGEVVAGSADYQLRAKWFNESTFRDLIMDIEHQLDRLDDEEEYEEEEYNGQFNSMFYRYCRGNILFRSSCRNEDR